MYNQRVQSVSSQELGEREGAMETRWNQVVLPVGREQDRVDACVVGVRGFCLRRLKRPGWSFGNQGNSVLVMHMLLKPFGDPAGERA
jgi:hypothetical protein